MDNRARLFFHKNPYDVQATSGIFLEAVRRNVAHHLRSCPSYAAMLRAADFHPDSLRSMDGLHRIPPIPTLYFKRNRISSIPMDKARIRATSSGTQGLYSQVVFDRASLRYGIGMMVRFFAYHKVISPIPVNYIVLGYPPRPGHQLGAAQTAYGTTRFAPALHRAYALAEDRGGWSPDIEGLCQALERYAKQGFAVRFVGFPAYLYFLMRMLREKGVSLALNKRSMILLGGGWKQHHDRQIDREEFDGLIQSTLGIPRERCKEFYSLVEHPIPYCRCENGHFHVPLYSRAIVRDVQTLKPVPNGETGLLSFVTPLVTSMPLTSVVTDDLATLQDEQSCGCGIDAPYFTLLGRSGLAQIQTCAAAAADMLGGLQP